MRLLSFLLVLGVFASCTTNPEDLPSATGVPGDIYLVMDSAQWKGALGATLDSMLNAEMPGLPREESIFKVRWINPVKLNSTLKRNRNLIFVMTLDRNSQGGYALRKLFTPESLEKIKSNADQYSMTDNNVFAKNQMIMYLFGKDEKTLLKNIRGHKKGIVDFLEQKERERLSNALFRGTSTQGIRETINREYQCDLKVPYGYKIADNQKNFIWLRQINPRDDKDVFIARKPYKSSDDFKKENILGFRDEVCAQYLFGDPDRPDSYLMTETRPYIPVKLDTINFNKSFAIRVRGLFRSNDFMLGGPFEGIALVDEGTHQFYYIEGFTISPGVPQREIMRELETVLYSFRPSTDLPKSGK